jgi:hypothetical protein
LFPLQTWFGNSTPTPVMKLLVVNLQMDYKNTYMYLGSCQRNMQGVGPEQSDKICINEFTSVM